MATITDKLASVRLETGYVKNSLYLKSADPGGVVYKYLVKTNAKAVRKEKFFELDTAEEDTVDDFTSRTVASDIEVDPAR